VNPVAPPSGRLWRQVAGALALLLLVAGNCFGVTVRDSGSELPVAGEYSYLEDPTASLGYEQIIRKREEFAPLRHGDAPDLGYSRSAFWMRVPLEVPGPLNDDWLLELPFPALDDVDVYLRAEGTGALVARYSAGDLHPFHSRPVDDANFVFPLPIREGGRFELFIRYQTEGSLTTGAYLWPERLFDGHSRTRYNLTSAFMGLLAGLLAYNLLLFVSLRDPTYLLYVLFTAALGAAQGAWNGFFFQYLWPDSPAWANVAGLVGFNATGLFGALFSRSFLSSRTHAPLLDRAILGCTAVFVLLLIGVRWLPYPILAMVTSATGLVFAVIAVIGGARCLLSGLISASYFLLAWLLLLAGTALLVANNIGLVPSNFFTSHALQIGSALEVLLLSFALGERVHAVRSQKEAAEAANRAKDDFLATVSHEIRTPLTVLLGNVGLLLSSQLQPQQAILARSAKRSGEQLLSLLNDLIDLSRIASGQLRLEAVPFSPGALVHEVAELVEAPARDKGLSLKVRIGFKRFYVLGDARRVRQVLLNLVFNAIKFTDRGEVSIEATIIEQIAGRVTLRLAVNDTGIGIRPVDQQRLFVPFSQVEGTQTRRGSGLGLAISRRLVEAMGGCIRLFSRPGQGSRFWFDLDLMLVHEHPEERRPLDHALPSLHLLLVDDVEESRTVLAAQLKQAGHSVTTAAGGQEALEALDRHFFDVVLMDLHMPEVDGFEAVRRLRMRPEGAAIPVFALTADVNSRTESACTKAGMLGVIGKPLHMDEFNAKLLTLFGESGHRPIIATEEEEEPAQERAQRLVNRRLLADRLELLGAAGLARVISVFGNVADERVATILKAAREGDAATCARVAHVLRGSAGAVGLEDLLELSSSIEHAALENPSQMARLAEELPELMRRSQEALLSWCRAKGVGGAPVETRTAD
jgi:signal transduction histidine kinase/CheY-like chemotaxis protein